MRNVIDFPKGLTFFTKRSKSKFFAELKKIFKDLNMPNFDCACAASDGAGGFEPDTTDSLPVRVNPTTLAVEYFDGNSFVPAGINTVSTADTITASTTQTQVGATALTADFNNVTVVANAGDSVRLPVRAVGQVVRVKNSSANAMNVFPSSGVSINALAVDTAISVAAGSTTVFTKVSATKWIS